jgi:DNA invertase Pin-like site-specific DNA recombinase
MISEDPKEIRTVTKERTDLLAIAFPKGKKGKKGKSDLDALNLPKNERDISRNVYGYCRVSTLIQTREDHHSLDRQKTKLEEWIVNGKHKKLDIKIDAGISGKSIRARPGLMEILSLIRTGEVLAVCSLDRLVRNNRETDKLMSMLSGIGAYLVLVEQNIDTSTPQGKLIFEIIKSLSEFERDQTSARVSANLLELSRKGVLRSKPPFGKKLDRDEKTGRTGREDPFVDNPEEQKVLSTMREICEREFKKGKNISDSELAIELNSLKCPCRKAKCWYSSYLKKVRIANDLYPKEILESEEIKTVAEKIKNRYDKPARNASKTTNQSKTIAPISLTSPSFSMSSAPVVISQTISPITSRSISLISSNRDNSISKTAMLPRSISPVDIS